MGYFRQLPNVEYQSFLDGATSQEYVLMKNIFVRGKIRDDLQNIITIFDKYVIDEDQRPDQIAEELYGSAQYDWVVLVTANIINYQNEFPLTSQQLWEYVIGKYGETGANSIKYYVTTEVRDSNERLVLPAGLTVDSDFTIPNPDIPGAILNPVSGVTNWEYETNINDEKKTIYVLKPSYLNVFLKDMRDISKYGFNSEFVNEKTIRVSNTKNTMP